jgi:glyoxalase family protein
MPVFPILYEEGKTMNNTLLGIHHVTAIAGDPQRNLDFYAGILGLRLVKKTVNFDDPYTYHLYFGDEIGHPGTLLTFFPWSAQAQRGTKGTGQIGVFSFSIPEDAVSFWMDRLRKNGVQLSKPSAKFSEEVINGTDHDGFQFELIASPDEKRDGWEIGAIPSKFAVRGFHSVTLVESSPEPTAEFLTSSLSFRKLSEEDNRTRYESSRGGGPGTFVDVLHQPDVQRGSMGVGIVHHVAWRTPTDETQLEIREQLVRDSLSVTPVIDRNYFHSIYFHEPGGVLFEVATDPPGFLIDEPKESLGTSLKLPAQYERWRNELDKVLVPLTIPRPPK